MQITADTINDNRQFSAFIASSDEGGSFEIDSDVNGVVFASGVGTGTRVMVMQTGTKIGGDGQVRVRIIPGRDTGDRAGTLEFKVEDGFGGVAPWAAFRA